MYASLIMPSRTGEPWEDWEDGKLRDDLRWGCLDTWILGKRLRRSTAEVRDRLAQWAAAGSGRISTLARSALINGPDPAPGSLARPTAPLVHSSREAAQFKGVSHQVAAGAARPARAAQRRQAPPGHPAP